jgi:hypothetical protein
VTTAEVRACTVLVEGNEVLDVGEAVLYAERLDGAAGGLRPAGADGNEFESG